MDKKEVILLETDPPKKLLSVIPQLVDPVTGQYNFPSHSFFEGVNKVHQEGFRGSGEIVAIADTGIDHTHPLLQETIVDAKDFTREGTVQDLHGHGTLVALIIRYVAPQARLLNAKALGQDGQGGKSALDQAMDWARQKHATVVNLSVGIESADPLNTYPKFLRRYLANKLRTHWLVSFLRGHRLERCSVCEQADRLIGSGIGVCAAVGNRKGVVTCPGRGHKRGMIMVGAAKIEGDLPTVASYSSYWPDLVAPELPLEEGTSFSTPFVTGVYCLLHELIETQGPPVGLGQLKDITSRGDFLFDKGYLNDAIALYLRAFQRDAHGNEHKTGRKRLEDCAYCKLYTYPVRTRLGMAYLQTGQPHLAEEQFAVNVQIVPTFPDAHMNLGAAYRHQGKYQEAVQEYSTALHLATKPEAYEGLAETFALMGDLDKAIGAFEASVKLNPNRAYPYQRLIRLCQQQGLIDKAQYYQNQLVSLGVP